MHAAFAAIGRFSVRFRWYIVPAWLVATILAGSFFPTLASVTKANNTDFLPAKTPSMVAAKLAEPFQKADLTPVTVVASRASGVLNTADSQAISALITKLKTVHTVTVVKDLGSSPDGVAEQLTVLSSAAEGQDGPLQSLVSDLRTAIAASPMPADLRVNLAGEIPSQIDTQKKSGSQGNKVDLLSIAFILVLLLVIFRSILAPFLTLIPAAIVVQLAGPIIAEATKAGLQVSTLSQIMLIVLILGAGTDYGLFLVFRVREEIRAGRVPKEAVVQAVTRVGESITFSAGTVIAALLSLLLATFGIYQSLGAPLAIGIALMLLAGLTLTPALLAIFGRAVFWPSKANRGAGKVPIWGRISTRIVRHPAITLTVGLVVFGGLAVAVSGYQAAGFGSALSAPSGSDSAAGNTVIDAHFPKSASNPTNVLFTLPTSAWNNPSVITAAHDELAASPVFNGVTGPLNPNGATLTGAELTSLHNQFGAPGTLSPVTPSGVDGQEYQAYRSTSNYLSSKGTTLQFYTSLTAGDPSTTAALHVVPQIRAAVAKVAHQIGASNFGVAGEAPGIYDVSALSNHDLVKVVPVAIIVIGLLLALVMRSAVAPLYLIASVALSYLAALGVSVLVFQELFHSGGLTFILPFLMFLFLLALGEDYNILVMSRIREEAHDLPLREAVARALTATGSTVTSAGLVLAGTFAVFAIAAGSGAGSSQIRDVGVGLTIGILMDTFFVRTLLVPSTVVLLGRWNWWPSTLGRRHVELESGVTVPASDSV